MRQAGWSPGGLATAAADGVRKRGKRAICPSAKDAGDSRGVQRSFSRANPARLQDDKTKSPLLAQRTREKWGTRLGEQRKCVSGTHGLKTGWYLLCFTRR